MDQLRKQVARARRRMNLQRVLELLPWSLLAALLVCVAALAIPKIWVVPVDPRVWLACWLGGSLAVGVLATLAYAYSTRRNDLEAASEIDHRFGLKERVSSALALTPDEADTDIGQALLNDSARRVERIEVAERFGVQAGWRALLPLLPLLAVFALAMFVPDATSQSAQASTDAERLAEIKKIKQEANSLKKSLERKRRQMEAKGLKDAELLLKELEKSLEDINSEDDVDRKKALVKINDMAQKLAERRQQLGDTEQMRSQLDKLKSIQQGPAEKLARAMKQGDFPKAMQELEKLKEQLSKGELSDEQRQQLTKQLEQMQQKVQEMQNSFEQAKQDLERQIQEKVNSGDMAGANDLQKQLDQLNRLNNQMERLAQMSQKMQQASNSLKQGNQQQAAQQLSQMLDELQQMQNEMDELATLNEMLDQIAECKNGMNQNGEGDMLADGFGDMGLDGMFGQPGEGLGSGQGRGERPEEATDTGNYSSKVAAKIQKGPAAVVGEADGPNRAGLTREEVKQVIVGELTENSDPLTDQRLPKDQLDHAKEYFERFRRGD